MNRHRTWLVALAGLFLLFAAGLAWLFQLRFETGDLYPPYSSLRTDPMGAKAFYEALELLPSVQVQRNFRLPNRFESRANATWLFLGTDPEEFFEAWPPYRKQFEALASPQGRLVVAFLPEHQTQASTNRAPALTQLRQQAKRAETVKPPLTFEKAWGFSPKHLSLTKSNDVYLPAEAKRLNPGALPESIRVHSSLYFDDLRPEWRVIYERDERPVVIERALPGGTVVLVADSYLFSNEALRNDRSSALLAWFLGGNSTVIFDETHLGVAEEPGVGTLLRKYRLHGVLVVLILLAALFAWQNASSLAPPLESQVASGHVVGRDATAGFVNLLRRGVEPRQVLTVCLEAWKKTKPPGIADYAGKLARMSAIVQEDSQAGVTTRDPVAAYRELCKIASESTFKPTRPKSNSHSIKPT